MSIFEYVTRNRRAWTILALPSIVFLMIWARAIFGAAGAYGEGEACLRAGQEMRAVTFFDRAIHWYAPFNPYVGRSAERLWEIKGRAEERGDIPLAIIALRSIRQGFYAARGLWTPGGDWIQRCDIEIDRLAAKKKIPGEAPGPLGVTGTCPPGASGDVNPDLFWTLVLEAGFLGWTGSVFGLMFALSRARRAPGRPLSTVALRWGTVLIICFSLWIIGMMLA